ncbi:thiamine pyrophosphate-binding protein [Oceanicola sp. 502str15]|uniref:thiamine pyrophosphate-binding protein n=1 Tax=Oceanicola sp. 502str15 TaxID=2696061 RepID=UPI002095F626|nr:thiamine pyrophosphate-binding protein [Oceanicola sp. 502str15]MCO6384760.1 thiamine pyrophosphate-binding protein [Oceanicola sp. 502str15]
MKTVVPLKTPKPAASPRVAELRHGGQVLVDQLAIRGIERVFSVPGESFLPVLDGLVDSGIANIVCRQEGGAAMMAEAEGKMTGEPGVLFVTRGPGASNASAGLHVARHDSTPMVVFVGQVPREQRDRDAFQEVDLRAFLAPVAKWTAEVDDAARLPEYIDRAFRLSNAGRPGPVVLSLPEDMLHDKVDVPDRPDDAFFTSPEGSNFSELVIHQIERSHRPLVIAGGSGWSAEASANLARFAEALDLPVAVPFRRQDYMDNRHPNYIGDLGVGMSPGLADAVRQADLIVALGTRLGDITTGAYKLLDVARPNKRIIQVHPDPDEIGKVYPVQLPFVAEAPAVLAKLARSVRPRSDKRQWTADYRSAYEKWLRPKETPGALKLEQVIGWLSDNLPEDAILTNGAGNYAAWLHRYYQFKRYGTQLAPTSGSMGYGLPAAIAAKLRHPGRVVVALAGDGCFQMTCNEMSTAVQHGAAPIVLVVNNGRYGTIRMHQEKTFPGRVSGTDLANPDFVALAQAYGGFGERVERTEDFAGAFVRAQASGRLAVLELVVDPEALSAGLTLSETREVGRKR